MKVRKGDLFEEMVSSLSMNFLDPEDGFQTEAGKYRLPGRLAVLAQGFAGGHSLEKVNETLKEKGYEALYARSFYEAGMIYSFSHRLTYDQWKKLFAEYTEKYQARVANEKKGAAGGKFTLKQLEEYVKENSSEEMQTQMLTRSMEKEIIESRTEEEFWDFMDRNIENFSAAREKARYYFCKYLNFYIREKCDKYYESCQKSEQTRLEYGNALAKEERGFLEKFALEELSFLKPLTKLKREAEKTSPSMSLEEKKNFLENTALTPGGIFDEFNYFYFGYVSVDWLELIFELYGGIQDWPENVKLRIAHALGYCSMAPSSEEKEEALAKLKKLEEEEAKKEAAMDSDHDRETGDRKKLYQRGRGGEDYFREFITGKRDINRETLISFLLFIKTNTTLDEDSKITIARLNRILENCGFSQLRPDREFDLFTQQFLRSSQPFEVLEKHVESKVTRGENFYLYKVYKDAYCHQDELEEYLGLKK